MKMRMICFVEDDSRVNVNDDELSYIVDTRQCCWKGYVGALLGAVVFFIVFPISQYTNLSNLVIGFL